MPRREYRTPQFPRVSRAVPRALVDKLSRPHAELSKRIDVNQSAVPRFLATELTLAVDEARRHADKLRAEIREARKAREKKWTTPRAPTLEGVWSLQVFATWAASQKDPAKAWRDLVQKKAPTPYERNLIQTTIELGIPVAGEATPMLFETRRRDLNLPDTVADEMMRLAEIEREKAAELAETRSVLLAGVSGASYGELRQLLGTELSAEEIDTMRDEDGTEAVQEHNAFVAMVKAATVSPEDMTAEAPRFKAAETSPFNFRAGS